MCTNQSLYKDFNRVMFYYVTRDARVATCYLVNWVGVFGEKKDFTPR